MPEKTTVKIAEVRKAVSKDGETLTEFGNEWKSLPEADKEQLRQGVADESMTY